MRSRHASTARPTCSARQVGERAHRVGRVDDHLVAPARRQGGEQVGLGRRARASGGVRAPAPGRGSAPRAPASRACRARRRRAQRVDLGRRAVLVARGERVASPGRSAARGVDRRGPPPGRRGALAGDDRAQPGERVDAELRQGALLHGARARCPPRRRARPTARVAGARRRARARRSGRAAPCGRRAARRAPQSSRLARAVRGDPAPRGRVDGEAAELRGRSARAGGTCRHRAVATATSCIASSSRPSSSPSRHALLVAEHRVAKAMRRALGVVAAADLDHARYADVLGQVRRSVGALVDVGCFPGVEEDGDG